MGRAELWCLAAALLAIAPVAAQSQSLDVTYVYDRGFAIDGSVKGACNGQILFEERRPGELRFASTSTGSVDVVETKWNETVLWPDTANEIRSVGDVRQTREVHPLPPGSFLVRLGQESRLRLLAKDWPFHANLSGVNLTLVGTDLRAGALTQALDGDRHFVPHPTKQDTTVQLIGAIGGWNRPITGPDLRIVAQGPAILYVQDAKVDGPADWSQETGVRRTKTGVAPPNGAIQVFQYVERHWLIRVGDIRLERELGGRDTVACNTTNLEVDGTLAAYHARGAYAAADGRDVAFSERELRMEGRFSVDEVPEPYRKGNPEWGVFAEASGQITGFWLDFQTPAAPAKVWEASMATAVAASIILVLAGYLFHSRLDRHRIVDHAHRGAIVEAVQQSPWVAEVDLERGLAISRGTLRYHLRQLVAHHVLAWDWDGQRRRYAVFAKPAATPPFLSTDPTLERILAQLERAPARPGELAVLLQKEFNYSRSGAWKLLHRYVERGVLELRAKGAKRWIQRSSAQS